jgi:hypothetical protein
MYAVAASSPDGIIEIFHSIDPFGRSMSPEIDSSSNRNEYQQYVLQEEGDKCGQYLWLTTLGPSCVICLEILGASTA